MLYNSKAILFSSCASLALVFSPTAHAQEDASDEDGARKLPTITVTSQKREESLQEVPISVTAITGETLEDNGVTTFENLSRRTPNMQVQVAEGGPATIIGIRGIASGFNRGLRAVRWPGCRWCC